MPRSSSRASKTALHSLEDGSPGTATSEFQGLLDHVKATTLALLASLQEKERTLSDRAAAHPSSGIARGLKDIVALRRWAKRTLQSIEILERGRVAELHALLQELGEFGEILRERQPTIPADPPAGMTE